MTTRYSIHPAIGIARVGNSPTEYFIGPERPYELPMPDSFKDAQLRIKRQAARFRVFAHHDDGTSQEISDTEAEITWSVHLANKKAAYPGRGNSEPAADLIIDPGPRSTTGPNQSQRFDGGRIKFVDQAAVEVPLGELRTDESNRLLVLGGFGHSASPAGNAVDDFWASDGWFDDIADGPVTATIKLRDTQETPPVTGAWVIVAPPKFAPHQDSVTTLFDRLQQTMIDAGLLSAPTTTSYTVDVYPILKRTRDIRWVYTNQRSNWDTKHAWAEPVLDIATRQAIFARLRPPSNMPLLAGSDSALTATQRAHLQRWKDDTSFVNDWDGPPRPGLGITPHGLDRAALEACVGGAFFPGIEAGGRRDSERPITTHANYAEPFRLNHAVVGPGDISASMALPWQADFFDCADNWWPVPRPNFVIPEGQTAYREWVGDVSNYEGMIAKWHTLGFVVQRGERHVEVDVTPTPSVKLLTPYLSFTDVAQGPLGMVRELALPIELEVSSETAAVTLELASGPNDPQLTAAQTTVSVPPTAPGAAHIARFWLIYATGDAGSALPTQVVTVLHRESGIRWSIEVDANTVARRPSAVALVLDRSASMADDPGSGQSKHASLQAAAEVFVDAMLQGDAVGVVRYNADAQPLQPLTTLGAGGDDDTERKRVIAALRGDGLDPQGATSIGDGLFEGHKLLDAADGVGTDKHLIVLTDGKENRPSYIADIAPDIDAQTYAIGLERAQNTSAVALQTLASNRGGYLLATGVSRHKDKLLLHDEFLEILASINESEVLLDRQGLLADGSTQRVPFVVSDADAGIDVLVVSERADALDFRLQAPSGRIIEPWRALAEPSMRFVHGRRCSYFRLTLPTQLVTGRFDREGTWHVLLKRGKLQLARSEDAEPGTDRSIVHGLHARPRVAQVRASNEAVDERERRYAVAQRAAAAQPTAAGARSESVLRRRIAYSVRVHAYSSLVLQTDVQQASHEPGASVQVSATLTQSGLPLTQDVTLSAELTGPKGDKTTRVLQPLGDGKFANVLVAAGSGVHALRVVARGRTRKGLPFVRERERSALSWRGADTELAPRTGDVQELLASHDTELRDSDLAPKHAREG
jgi:hypothetical protein